jgi:hypothetical protein
MTTKRFKKSVLMVGVAAGLIAGSLAVPGAAGALPVLHGDLKCSVGDSPMQFSRPLTNPAFNPQPPPVRSATLRYSAPVTACRGTTPTTPAPGGIHHGVVELKGRVYKSNCAKVPSAPKLKLTLYDASGTQVVARSHLKPVAVADYSALPIYTFTFSGPLKSSAKSFGGEVISLQIAFDGNDFNSRCLTSAVTTIPMFDSEITIGNPT